MPVSFGNFINQEYKNLKDGMKKIYGSQAKFKTMYLANQGLHPWLETMRGHEISNGLVNNIVKTYIQEMNRTPSEMPAFLATISRDFDVELPVVEGILNADYWEKKAEQFGWTNNRMSSSPFP